MDKRAKAHLYMSEYQTQDDRYQAGQRRQNPIEIEIDLAAALHDGYIAFRTRAGAILSVFDMHTNTVLWHRDLQDVQPGAGGSSQEPAIEQVRTEQPRQEQPAAEHMHCPECSSERVSGTSTCLVCGYLFDVEIKNTGNAAEQQQRQL